MTVSRSAIFGYFCILFTLLPAMARRARACPSMSAETYEGALHEWLSEHPQLVSFEMLLGPMVADARRVSNVVLMCVLPLFRKLISKGANDAVLHGHRLEGALKHLIVLKPQLAGSLGAAAHHVVAEHLSSCVKMLRDYHRESQTTWCLSARAFPKSSTLRKQLSVQEMTDVHKVSTVART